MNAIPCSIGGELVTTQLASKMEETMQAFAVRAACFIGELGVPFSEEFDGHDFGGTHLLAYAGTEPVGTVRVRWFQNFAMPERLAVIRRFRGHNLGRLLLKHCCKLAESRGCTTLYSRVPARLVEYVERQGWRCLEPEVPDDSHVFSYPRIMVRVISKYLTVRGECGRFDGNRISPLTARWGDPVLGRSVESRPAK